MSDNIICPHCGNHLAKGSTFCIKCGNRVPENLRTITADADSLSWDEPITPTSPHETTSIADDSITLSDPDTLDLSPSSPAHSKSPEEEIVELPPVELSWDDVETPVETPQPIPDPTTPPLSSPPLRPIEPLPSSPPLRPIDDSFDEKDPDLSWEEPASTAPSLPVEDLPIREVEPSADLDDAMPFTEVEPPKVFDEAPDTDEAITHLFPDGCSDTTPDFIDAVVGKAEKITISTPMPELDTPSCPSCGVALSGDDFEYPPYVYSAMGKARLDHGIDLLLHNEPQDAIESFERAKKLFEQADDQKGIEFTIRKIDEGYDGMGHSHFNLGEKHLRAGEFEWAVVQFRKAREIYMLSTDTKLRTRCAERIRICYMAWGKSLEDEADRLSKEGDVRTALERYKQAAEKYRDGGDNKRLKGLERKIKKA